jgi:hypothetical protein
MDAVDSELSISISETCHVILKTLDEASVGPCYELILVPELVSKLRKCQASLHGAVENYPRPLTYGQIDKPGLLMAPLVVLSTAITRLSLGAHGLIRVSDDATWISIRAEIEVINRAATTTMAAMTPRNFARTHASTGWTFER